MRGFIAYLRKFKVFFLLVFNFILSFVIAYLISFAVTKLVVESALTMNEELEQTSNASATQTTEDDIACNYTYIKSRWPNCVLSRPELDARKSDVEYAVAANPLAPFAELFNNDYDSFSPKNLMIRHAKSAPGGRPTKICPYQASASKWSYLATCTHALDPTNAVHKKYHQRSRGSIIIKEE